MLLIVFTPTKILLRYKNTVHVGVGQYNSIGVIEGMLVSRDLGIFVGMGKLIDVK